MTNNSTIQLTDALLREGDIFNISGVYKKRTFFQWLFMRPKMLQTFKVVDANGTTATIETF